MRHGRFRVVILVVATAVIVAAGVVASQLPALGAGGLLHPARRAMVVPLPETCEDVPFKGAGVDLKGWRCRGAGARRGTLVYLHGIADNRGSAVGIVQRFTRRGFDVIAYDSRGHGESSGDTCTYGFFEKQDLRLVLDTIEQGPIVLMGTSLGAAVALQEAGEDDRVGAVVAAETFSDLRTVAIERAPFFFTMGTIERAFEVAESEGHFKIDAVSPQAAARTIGVPVLLIHGSMDHDTPPEHSRRVFEALHGPKQLILVPDAGHNQSLRGEVWQDIDRWIDRALPMPAVPR
jgi:alpha-beta hydrolase superfamily lysophospholipase